MYDIPDAIVRNALEKAIDVLIAKYRSLGMESTGDWSRELDAVVGINAGEIWGAHYTEQLVFGREPGKRPPISPLERWASAKFGVSGREATSMAFAVATKIAKEGTGWYQKGGSDLLEVLDDPQVVDTFYSEIGSYLRVMVVEDLQRDLQTLAE